MWTRGQLYIAAYAVTSTALFAASLVTLLAHSYDFLTLAQEFTFDTKLVVLLNFIACFYLLWMLATIRLFFGELRVIEMEHIADRIPFSMVTLLFLLLDDENLILDWIWFGLTLCMKVYHTIVYDRIDFLQVKIVSRLSDSVGAVHHRWGVLAMYTGDISVLLLLLFMILDVLMAKLLAYDVFQGLGSIESLLFGIQFGVMGIESFSYLGKLALNMCEVLYYRASFGSRLVSAARAAGASSGVSPNERSADANSDAPEITHDTEDFSDWDDDDFDEQVWENKAFYVQTFSIFLSALKASFYMLFLWIIWSHSNLALPGTILQGSITSIYLLYKQAIQFRLFLYQSRRLDNFLSTATETELAAADHMCIICRENMHWPATYERMRKRPLHPRKYPKKLRCGHILHLACLKDWLERSESCPLCRKKVFQLSSEPGSVPALPQMSPGAHDQEAAQTFVPTATDVEPVSLEGHGNVSEGVNDTNDAAEEVSRTETFVLHNDRVTSMSRSASQVSETSHGAGSPTSTMSSLAEFPSTQGSYSSGSSRIYVPRDWLCLPLTRTESTGRYAVRLSENCVGNVVAHSRTDH